MKYINTKTGIVQEFACKVQGGDWQAVQPASAAQTSENIVQTPTKQPRKRVSKNE